MYVDCLFYCSLAFCEYRAHWIKLQAIDRKRLLTISEIQIRHANSDLNILKSFFSVANAYIHILLLNVHHHYPPVLK